jgi:hypothetical protein
MPAISDLAGAVFFFDVFDGAFCAKQTATIVIATNNALVITLICSPFYLESKS